MHQIPRDHEIEPLTEHRSDLLLILIIPICLPKSLTLTHTYLQQESLKFNIDSTVIVILSVLGSRTYRSIFAWQNNRVKVPEHLRNLTHLLCFAGTEDSEERSLLRRGFERSSV